MKKPRDVNNSRLIVFILKGVEKITLKFLIEKGLELERLLMSDSKLIDRRQIIKYPDIKMIAKVFIILPVNYCYPFVIAFIAIVCVRQLVLVPLTLV
jgi:hypothetical protein